MALLVYDYMSIRDEIFVVSVSIKKPVAVPILQGRVADPVDVISITVTLAIHRSRMTCRLGGGVG